MSEAVIDKLIEIPGNETEKISKAVAIAKQTEVEAKHFEFLDGIFST